MSVRRIVGSATGLALSSFAHAQSCVMCYTSTSAQNPHARHAMNAGILILLVPALSCLAAIVVRTVHASRE
jgi:hypothetical protein